MEAEADRLRDEGTISDLLERTYADKGASLGNLPALIRGVTERSQGGHAAFASIMWSRPATLWMMNKRGRQEEAKDFYALLTEGVEQDCLLLYGAEDPWCSPEFGRSAMRALQAREEGSKEGREGGGGEGRRTRRELYVELSPSGHCPHHETPEATNSILSRWIGSRGRDGCFDGERFGGGEGGGRKSAVVVTATEVNNCRPRSLWERALTAAVR